MKDVNQLVIVFNTVVPYGYELVNILAYPNGFVQRFRFEEEWLDLSKANWAEKDAQGYVVLRDWETALLYPIRRFKLITYEKIGSIHFLQCELGQLFEFDSDDSRRVIQLREFNDELNKARTDIRESNIPNGHMKPLVFTSGYDPHLENFNSTAHRDLEAKNNERWANILLNIKGIAFYSSVEFLRIIGVSEQGCPARKAIVSDYAYVVKRGLNYEVAVAQYRPGGLKKDGTSRDISLVGDNDALVPIRASQRAVGKYDILSFVFQLNRNSRIKRSFFDLKFTPIGDSAPYVNPLIQVPVEVHTPFPYSIGIKSILVIALLIFYFIPALLTSILLPPSVFGIDSTQLAHDLAIFLLAVTATDLLTEIRKQ